MDHDICLADWEKKVDRCFDEAFEKVSLDLLLEDVKKEMKEKFPYVNESCWVFSLVLFVLIRVPYQELWT